ncbi:hypothetical protein GJAV_G00226940 [Gymnothorax javanicus]|nr:hypothetical protein GJAV_G00226940 [Gymnothorax javanicus]
MVCLPFDPEHASLWGRRVPIMPPVALVYSALSESVSPSSPVSPRFVQSLGFNLVFTNGLGCDASGDGYPVFFWLGFCTTAPTQIHHLLMQRVTELHRAALWLLCGAGGYLILNSVL